MKVRSNNRVGCTNAQELLSAYIDSMTTREEALRLESHMAHCAACRQDLQSLSAMRKMLARVEPVEPPEDLVLETRVKLSHARNRDYRDWFDTHVKNVLKPLAMPALFGVSLTTLFFFALFGSIVSNSTILAPVLVHSPVSVSPAEVVSDGNPQWTNPNVVELASGRKGLDEAAMVAFDIGADGRVVDYNIISGRRSAATDRWIKDVLSLARFTPATAFGKPVSSTIIITSIDVRG